MGQDKCDDPDQPQNLYAYSGKPNQEIHGSDFCWVSSATDERSCQNQCNQYSDCTGYDLHTFTTDTGVCKANQPCCLLKSGDAEKFNIQTDTGSYGFKGKQFTSCETTGDKQYKYAVQTDKSAGGNDICTVPNIDEATCQKACSNSEYCTHYEFGKGGQFMTCVAGQPCCYIKNGTPNINTLVGNNIGVKGAAISGGGGGGGGGADSATMWIIIVIAIGLLLIAGSIVFTLKHKKKAATGGDNIHCGYPQNPYYTGIYSY